MTTRDTEPYEAAPPGAPPSRNSFQRIAGVLFAPAETFRDIARRPDVVVPLIVIVLAYFLSAALVVPRTDYSAANAMQADAIKKQNPNMSEADLERAQSLGNAAQTVIGWVSPLLWIIWYVLVAAVLLLLFRLFGGEGTFKQAFSVTLYAWIPIAIFRILRGIIATARGSVDALELQTIVKSNPAFLVDFKEQGALFGLLGALDIFSIWTVVLLIFGFSAVSRMSKGKSAAIIISLYVVLALIGAGFAAFGSAQMKG